jgi:hypothetical protein
VGPHKGQALLYEWQWHYSAPGLIVWLVLIAAVVGLRANRNCRVLLILVPLAVVNLLYLLLKKLSGMTSSSAAQFDVVFQAAAIGVTLLWLVAPVLGRQGIHRIVVAFVLLMAVAGLSVFSYGTVSSEETAIFLVFLGSLGGLLVLAPAAATRLCRRLYRPVGFMLWLAVWMIVGGVVATLGAFAILLSVLSSGPPASEIPEVILQIMTVGSILGLCLYVLYLPYMLLGFASPFFRTRLQACLSLEQPDGSEGE